MPESDGNPLPSEQSYFNLQGIEERQVKANSLKDLGLLGLNRHTLPFVIESFAFGTANKNYEEAVECYRYGLYEASMVMARATIDAALFISKYLIIDQITGYDRGMGGGLGGHWNLKKTKILRKECNIKLESLGINVKIDAKMKRLGEWKELYEEAKTLNFSLKERGRIERIRERYGNFSAHNAEAQMEENQRYASLSEAERITAKKPKWIITESDAYYIIRQTGMFLSYIRRTYANRSIRLLASAQSSIHT